MRKKGVGGNTKLNNSHKSTEHGLNFSCICWEIFFKHALTINTKNQIAGVVQIFSKGERAYGAEKDCMTNPLG